MGWEIWGTALAFGAVLAVLILRDQLANRGQTLTGQGTVAGRTVQASFVSTGLQDCDRQLFRITFCLSDGEELSLYVPEETYLTLEDGTHGQLTWRKDTLIQFLPES